ncbi:MAG TPA: hypothetical protein VJ600_02775 [Holophagaceae bacterium]|nr:hypothetical protein [Holophagaceae bacterium]
MASLDDACRAADHLRARSEVEHGSLGTLLMLLAASIIAANRPDEGGLHWHVALLALLLVGPILLRRILPKGNLLTFRLGLAAYPYNTLMLAFIAWMEASRIPPLQVEDLPQLRWLFPVLALAVPVGYAIIQFPEWIRRIQLLPQIRKALALAPPVSALGEVAAMVAQATSSEPTPDAPWAEFRTVPARPGNWRAFLRLDIEEHGVWRVAFGESWAVVVFKDGRRCEVVPRGGIRIVVDDEAHPGSRHQLCVVRWNTHLHEGRITAGDFLKVSSWNAARP